MNDPPVPFRFSVRMLLWATALFAIAFGFFESPFNAIILGELLITYSLLWAFDVSRLKSLLFLLFIASLNIAWILPAPRYAYVTSISMYKLKLITLSIHNYRETQDPNCFPPCYTLNEGGEKLHSWRSLVLPFAEEYRLANKINYNLSWDSKENKELLAGADIQHYDSPCRNLRMKGLSCCTYLAIVDEQSAWPTGKPRLQKDFTDSPSETIILIENPDSDIVWQEPRDLTLDEAVNLLTKPTTRRKSFKEPTLFRRLFKDPQEDGHLVAFADGAVLFIRPIKDPNVARALLTCNGGEDLSGWRNRYEMPTTEISIVIRCLQLVIFIAVATYPYWQKQPPPTTSPANLSEGE